VTRTLLILSAILGALFFAPLFLAVVAVVTFLLVAPRASRLIRETARRSNLVPALSFASLRAPPLHG
jgi:hypothetical protein